MHLIWEMHSSWICSKEKCLRERGREGDADDHNFRNMKFRKVMLFLCHLWKCITLIMEIGVKEESLARSSKAAVLRGHLLNSDFNEQHHTVLEGPNIVKGDNHIVIPHIC